MFVLQDLLVSSWESGTPGFFMNSQKWKSNGVRSGERGGQAGPSCPILLLAKGVIQVETRQDLVAQIQVTAGVIRDMPGNLSKSSA